MNLSNKYFKLKKKITSQGQVCSLVVVHIHHMYELDLSSNFSPK